MRVSALQFQRASRFDCRREKPSLHVAQHFVSLIHAILRWVAFEKNRVVQYHPLLKPGQHLSAVRIGALIEPKAVGRFHDVRQERGGGIRPVSLPLIDGQNLVHGVVAFYPVLAMSGYPRPGIQLYQQSCFRSERFSGGAGFRLRGEYGSLMKVAVASVKGGEFFNGVPIHVAGHEWFSELHGVFPQIFGLLPLRLPLEDQRLKIGSVQPRHEGPVDGFIADGDGFERFRSAAAKSPLASSIWLDPSQHYLPGANGN